MRILIVKRDKIGDMLLTTPLLAHLRAQLPDAEIHVLANDYNAWVLDGNPDVDKIWIVPRVRHDGHLRLGAIWHLWCMRKTLRKLQFDWVLVGNGEISPRAIRLGLSVKGRRTIAYAPAAGISGLSHPLPPPTVGHESMRLMQLAQPIVGAPSRQLPEPRYLLPATLIPFSEQWQKQHGLTANGYIIIGLGARKLRKKPSPEQVLRWASLLRERWGKQTVLIWTPGSPDNKLYPGDDDLAADIIAAAGGVIIPFQGSLHQTLALIWSAATSIIPDSGLMHFAAASPGGVIGLFAHHTMAPPADQWGPTGSRAICLESSASVPELDDALLLNALHRRLDA